MVWTIVCTPVQVECIMRADPTASDDDGSGDRTLLVKVKVNNSGMYHAGRRSCLCPRWFGRSGFNPQLASWLFALAPQLPGLHSFASSSSTGGLLECLSF